MCAIVMTWLVSMCSLTAPFSDECINNCDNEMNALSLVDSLPELNKKLLLYLVDFLKVHVCSNIHVCYIYFILRLYVTLGLACLTQRLLIMTT